MGIADAEEQKGDDDAEAGLINTGTSRTFVVLANRRHLLRGVQRRSLSVRLRFEEWIVKCGIQSRVSNISYTVYKGFVDLNLDRYRGPHIS